MTVLAELDKLIKVLEAEIPANPESAKNIRLKNRLAKVLEKYFRNLEKAFPYSKLDSLYNKYVESIRSDTRAILDPLLAVFDTTLKAEIEDQMAEIYLSGRAEMITWGKTKGGIPIAYEGPPIRSAIEYARIHSARLVKDMSETTKQRLALHISDGIKSKRGIPGLARDIRTQFDDMTKFRSQMIARTETADALSQASLETMEDMGIDGKEWVTVGDSDVSDECLANEAQGVIPVGDTFTSGVSAPPQHPNCRCAVAPARLPSG